MMLIGVLIRGECEIHTSLTCKIQRYHRSINAFCAIKISDITCSEILHELCSLKVPVGNMLALISQESRIPEQQK